MKAGVRIGAHLSVARGFPAAARDAVRIGADTFQFFSRNPRGGAVRALDGAELEEWEGLRARHALGPLVVHLPYTVNLAAPEDRAWQFAVMVLEQDLPRAAQLGAAFVVSHPGSHTARSAEADGLARIVRALERGGAVLEGIEPGRRPVLCLETMSGQGTELGRTPAQLGALLDALGRPPWLGVCVDACHVFAAGYDLRRPAEVDRLAADLDAAVGLDRVHVVHVNDSKYPCGSRVDRHACIDRGEIGLGGLLHLVEHPAFAGRPLILETPVERAPEGWGEEIRMIREAVAARGRTAT